MEIWVSRYVREMIGIFTRVSCEQSLGRGLALMSFIVHHRFVTPDYDSESDPDVGAFPEVAQIVAVVCSSVSSSPVFWLDHWRRCAPEDICSGDIDRWRRRVRELDGVVATPL